jgi:hypothetical protein
MKHLDHRRRGHVDCVGASENAILLETEALRTVWAMPDGGRSLGSSRFELRVFETADDLPTHGMSRPAAAWRKDLIPNETVLHVGPPPAFEGAMAVAVPRALLESLRDFDLVEFRWTFVPAALDGMNASPANPSP